LLRAIQSGLECDPPVSTFSFTCSFDLSHFLLAIFPLLPICCRPFLSSGALAIVPVYSLFFPCFFFLQFFQIPFFRVWSFLSSAICCRVFLLLLPLKVRFFLFSWLYFPVRTPGFFPPFAFLQFEPCLSFSVSSPPGVFTGLFSPFRHILFSRFLSVSCPSFRLRSSFCARGCLILSPFSLSVVSFPLFHLAFSLVSGSFLHSVFFMVLVLPNCCCLVFHCSFPQYPCTLFFFTLPPRLTLAQLLCLGASTKQVSLFSPTLLSSKIYLFSFLACGVPCILPCSRCQTH